jgi:hypothetical protein
MTMRTPRKNPAADRLVFHIGPFLYTLVISERRIYDPEGNELEGAAIESRRLLMLSFALPVHRREDIAAEELAHAYEFHFPVPRTNEERARLSATVATGFRRELDEQGGIDALNRLPAQYVPSVGNPKQNEPRPISEMFLPTPPWLAYAGSISGLGTMAMPRSATARLRIRPKRRPPTQEQPIMRLAGA